MGDLAVDALLTSTTQVSGLMDILGLNATIGHQSQNAQCGAIWAWN